MTKRSFVIGLLILFAAGAQAQIVTPYLDPGLNSRSPATVGWKDGSVLSMAIGVAGGYVETDIVADKPVEIGEATSEADAFPLPLIVLKNNIVGMELFYTMGDGIIGKVEGEMSGKFMDTTADYSQSTYVADKNSHLYLSSMFGENLSMGLGYSQRVIKTRLAMYLSLTGIMDMVDWVEREETTTTGLSLVASYRLADSFFVALGRENVTRTGTFERITTTDLASLFPAHEMAEYVENTWSNWIMGIGMRIGEPNESQFRMEVSRVAGPESKKEAEVDKHASYNRKHETTYASVEAKFGSFLLSYRSEKTVKSRMPELLFNEEDNTTHTLYGVGWVDPEGLSVVAYSYNLRQFTDSDYTDGGMNLDLWLLNFTYPL